MEVITLFPYNKQFSQLFEKEKQKITALLPNCEIHHIGSTAVPGLGGKGIIDILVGLKDWKNEQKVIAQLKKIGFLHMHPKITGRIFLSHIKTTKYKDAHIHIVKTGGKQYHEMLAFRDYLLKHAKEARHYYALKKNWCATYENDRGCYRLAKQGYVLEILEKTKSTKRLS